MKLKEIFFNLSNGKVKGFNPFEIELHELKVGQKINAYLCEDTIIQLYEPKEKPLVRVVNKNKAFFIQESLEDFYKKIFDKYFMERRIN
jgi:hypothetical protein